MTAEEILIGLLNKSHGLSSEEITPILYKEGTEKEINDTALESFLALDVERVKKLKPDTKAAIEKAKTDAITAITAKIKEQYKLEVDEADPFKLIETVLSAKAPQGGTELTEDKVLKSKWYLDAVEASNNKVKQLETDFDQKVNEFKVQMTKSQTFQTVKDQALAIFNGLNPILPTDTIKAKTQIDNLFVRELEASNYEVRDGKIVLIDKDGNDLQDGHGNRIPFDNHVKSVAERAFEFKASTDRSSAGNAGDGGAGSGGAAKPVTASTGAELLKAFTDAKTPEEKDAALDRYNEMKKAGQI
jgi:hypothetical protein